MFSFPFLTFTSNAKDPASRLLNLVHFQVICAECNNVSNQFENMMDLTVEIHGDAGSMEECLDQFTAKERLHGDNMYKCDG